MADAEGSRKRGDRWKKDWCRYSNSDCKVIHLRFDNTRPLTDN